MGKILIEALNTHFTFQSHFVLPHINSASPHYARNLFCGECGEEEFKNKKDRNLKEIQKRSSQRLSLNHFYTF